MSVMSLTQVRREPKIAKRGRFAVPKFCGWSELETFYHKSTNPEVQGLFATLFSTGTRVSECLKLHSDMFVVEDDTWLTVFRVPVLKKGSKAKIADTFRNIPIIRNEIMAEYMMNFVQEQDGFLFSKSRQWAWQSLVNVDEKWWPHRVRSERATQLHIEYDYQVPELMKWFHWNTPGEAVEYVRLGTSDLKKKAEKYIHLP